MKMVELILMDETSDKLHFEVMDDGSVLVTAEKKDGCHLSVALNPEKRELLYKFLANIKFGYCV